MDKPKHEPGNGCQRYFFLPVTVKRDAKKKWGMQIPLNELPKSLQRGGAPRILKLRVNSSEQRTRKPNEGHVELKLAPIAPRPSNPVKTWTMWRIVATEEHFMKEISAAHSQKTTQSRNSAVIAHEKMPRPGPTNSKADFQAKMTQIDPSMTSPRTPPTESIISVANSLEMRQPDPGILAVDSCPKAVQSDLSIPAANSKKILQPEPGVSLTVSNSVMYPPVIPVSTCTSRMKRLKVLSSGNGVPRLSALAIDTLVTRGCPNIPVTHTTSPGVRSEVVKRSLKRERSGILSVDSEILRQRNCVSPESGIDRDESGRCPYWEPDSPRNMTGFKKLAPCFKHVKPQCPSSRVKETSLRKRMSHNEDSRPIHSRLEKIRRREMSASFVALRNVLPEFADQGKVTQVTILKKAREHCLSLRMQELALLSQKVGLNGRRLYLQQIMNFLKTDSCSDRTNSAPSNVHTSSDSLGHYEEFLRLLMESRTVEAPRTSSPLSFPGGSYVSSLAGSRLGQDDDEEIDVVGVDDMLIAQDMKQQLLSENDWCDIASDLRIVSVHSLADSRVVYHLPKCSRLCIRNLKGPKCGLKRVLMVDADYSSADPANLLSISNEPPVKKCQRIAEETDILIDQMDGCASSVTISHRRNPSRHSAEERIQKRQSEEASLRLVEWEGAKTLEQGKNGKEIPDSAEWQNKPHVELRSTPELKPGFVELNHGASKSGRFECGQDGAASGSNCDNALLRSACKSDLVNVYERSRSSVAHCFSRLGRSVTQRLPELSGAKKSLTDADKSRLVLLPQSGSLSTEKLGGGDLGVKNSNHKLKGSDDAKMAKACGKLNCDSNQTGVFSTEDIFGEKSCEECCGEVSENKRNPTENYGHLQNPLPPDWRKREYIDYALLPEKPRITNPYADGQFCEVEDRLTGESLMDDDECLLACAFDEEDPSIFAEEDHSEYGDPIDDECRYFDLKNESLGDQMSPVVKLGRIKMPDGIKLASGFGENGLSGAGRTKDNPCFGASKTDLISELRRKLKQREADLEKVRESMGSFGNWMG